MDDLKLLRDLGDELEHQPPVTLVRQRDRFLRARPRRRWPGWWTAGLVAVATATAVAVPTVLIADRHSATPATEADLVDMSGTRNVLVIGSDTREGEGNAQYGPMQARENVGQRSDTIMIIHLPADRSRSTAVSVPRDSMVRIPACGSEPARTDLINSAYAKGGATCLRSTLEKLTGLRLHHTVEVDFTGFKNMVDAIGGVTIKVAEPVDDRMSKLKLPAGQVTLNGEKALGYVRLRYVGDGSDLARIKRQQVVVVAMLKKVQRSVADPPRLKAFVAEMRKGVKTDLDVEEMFALGEQLARTRMNTVSVPAEPAEQRLRWKQPEARKLFESLK
ncbi:LCP family protein [Nonomuraea sp. NPDC050404]|uniref:LCP family protein n=1 Tax=Nonomuraea sp. NPDC050404 TaxID=3155783 RepID=UPI0033FE4E90